MIEQRQGERPKVRRTNPFPFPVVPFYHRQEALAADLTLEAADEFTAKHGGQLVVEDTGFELRWTSYPRRR